MESNSSRLNDKIQGILKKYENRPRLYPKLVKISSQFQSTKYVNPKYYTELAKLTAKIKFKCNFEKGRCRAERTEMCCCSSCMRSYGHFSERFFAGYTHKNDIEEELLYYARKFSTKTGFWRKGEGCILPREKRSSTCLGYNCNKNITNEEKLLISIIRDYRRYVPDYIKELILLLKDYFLYRQ